MRSDGNFNYLSGMDLIFLFDFIYAFQFGDLKVDTQFNIKFFNSIFLINIKLTIFEDMNFEFSTYRAIETQCYCL